MLPVRSIDVILLSLQYSVARLDSFDRSIDVNGFSEMVSVLILVLLLKSSFEKLHFPTLRVANWVLLLKSRSDSNVS